MQQNVLAIDASSEGCSVALSFQGETYSRTSEARRKHAQSLLPMIDEVLEEARASLPKLNYIALVNGPGSFTGIRIAISVVQGLAYGANLPIFCMSSLVTMAEQQRASHPNAYVVSALDARMGEVYWATYDLTDKVRANASPAELSPPSVLPTESFGQSISDLLSECAESKPLILVGSGFGIDTIGMGDTSSFDKSLDALQVHKRDQTVEPSAVALLRLALAFEPAEQDFCSAEQVEPLYLRNEVAWKKRKRIRS